MEQQTEQQEKRLEELNQLRESSKTVGAFTKTVERRRWIDLCKSTVSILEELDVPSSLQNLSNQLEQMGRLDTAEQQTQLWNILMDILDQCASGLEHEALTVQRFSELLRLMILSYDVAGIPQSLDHVTVGTVDRMRPAQPKVVFVIGAVQGEFPAVPSSRGVFSDLERQSLIQLGLPLSDTAQEAAIEEQFWRILRLLALPQIVCHLASCRAYRGSKSSFCYCK